MSDIGNRIWHLFEKLIYLVLSKVYKLMKKDFTDDAFADFMQFVKFGMVGLSNTIISYVIYVVCLLLIREFLWGGVLRDNDYLLAQIAAFVLSVLWSFYWNNKFVFSLQEGEQRSVFRSLVKMFITYSFTGLFLSSILLILWVRVLHISELIAPVINLVVTVPLNFLINKLWTFGKQK